MARVPRYPARVTLLLLTACRNPYAYVADPECPPADAIVVTDPEGVASELDLSDAESVLARFLSWTGAETVCVEEIRFVTNANPDVDSVVGQYSPGEHLVEVEPDASSGVRFVVFHELCHGWDRAGEFSATYEELLPDYGPLNPAAYASEGEVTREYFAMSCDDGAPAAAIAEAAVAACGAADPWQTVLRDEVFAAYTEDISIGVGPPSSNVPLDVPDTPGGLDVAEVRGFGDTLAVLLRGEGMSLALFDLTTLTWTQEVTVPLEDGERARFLRTTPDTAPVLHVSGGAEDRLYVLEGAELVPHPADWILPLLESTSSLSLGADGALWQLWGDGVPLQWRGYGDEAAVDVPGAGSRPLYPSSVLLPEGELLWESAYYPDVYPVFTEDGLVDANVPPGVWPKATTTDGRVVASADLVGFAGDDGSRRGLVTRDADGGWSLDPGSCALTDYQGSFYTGGGRVVRYLGDLPFRLEEVVP